MSDVWNDINYSSLWYYDLLELIDDQGTSRHTISNFNEILKLKVQGDLQGDSAIMLLKFCYINIQKRLKCIE